MDSTFGDAIELEAVEQDAIDTHDNVARGTIYAIAFSAPLWVVIIAVVMAVAG
jgi:hypothetical protein